MHFCSRAAATISFRRQADAVIGDFESAIGGAHRDLFGAV